MYIDVDFECLQSLDALHAFDFYIGIQPLDTTMVQLGIGIIGACPGHPLLKKAIDLLPANHEKKQIIAKTGPIFFTKVIIDSVALLTERDAILPASYFYPCGYTEKRGAYNDWVKPESLAVHHWAGSWLSQKAFEK